MVLLNARYFFNYVVILCFSYESMKTLVDKYNRILDGVLQMVSSTNKQIKKCRTLIINKKKEPSF